MNNRKARRSSILKPPKQTVRAPFQDLDSDDDGNLTQPTNRRVSFSRTSQIKEFDPTIGYMTNWHQSYEESLESLEGDENQAKSANVFDGLASVQTQKKFKRKRTSTVQLSLTINNDETNSKVCSNSNPSILQNSGARANKQPRKSLDCFQAELAEEGDTSIFFDELNLTEPIKSSYSNIDASTNLTMTLMDSMFNNTDADLSRSKTDVPTGHSSESSSKCVGNDPVKLIQKLSSGGAIEDILPNKDHIVIHADQNAPCDAPAKYGTINTSMDSMNMDCTLAPGKIEVMESFIDIERLGNQRRSSCMERNSIDDLPKDDNENKIIGSRGSSMFGKDKNNIEDLLPSASLSNKGVHYRESKEDFDGNSSLEASMELTIPQIPLNVALPNVNYSARNAQVNKSVRVNVEVTDDLDMTGTWGQIVEQKNSVLPSEDCVVTDKPKSLMDILNANGDFMKEKVVDSTVSSDMELSMTAGGIVIQDNIENGCANLTQGSGISEEVCAALEGMELTVPVGKLKMSKAGDDSENIDPQPPFEIHEVLGSNQTVTVTEKNLEDCLPEVMGEQSCVADAVNDCSFSIGLDETCGMEMTVPLGKIREKMLKDSDENVVENDVVKDGNPFEEVRNGKNLDDMLREGQKTIGETNVEQLSSSTEHHNDEVLIDPQMVKETSHEAVKMRETVDLKLQQSHGEHDGHVENMDSLLGNETNMVRRGMDMTVSHGRLKDKGSDSVHNPMANNLNGNDTNPDVIGMELTVPLGVLRREKMLNISSTAASSSHIEGVVCRETSGMDMTLPSQNMRAENSEGTAGDTVTESHVIESNDPDALDMEFTVPLGKLKDMKSAGPPEPLADSQIVDPEALDMEFTVPLGKLKDMKSAGPPEPLADSQIVDPDALDMEFTVPLGKLKDMKSAGPPEPQADSQIVDPDALDMEFTVPLGKLKDMKCAGPPEPLAESQIVDDANPDTMGMELTVPLGRLKPGKHNYSNDNVLPESHIMDETIPDTMGMELTVPLGRLTGAKGKDSVDNELPQNQLVDDTNPETMGMEFTVPLGRMTGEKNRDPVDSVLPQMKPNGETLNEKNDSPAVDVETNTDMGMEFTVPLGRLMGDKSKDSNSDMQPQNQAVSSTSAEMSGMELTVPLGRMKAGNNDGHAENVLCVPQIVNDTNSELTGMEFTVPLGKMKRVNGSEPFSNFQQPTHTVDETNPQVRGSEVPLERRTEVESAKVIEETWAETIVESKLMDGTDLEARTVYSSVAVLNLREENISHTENFTTENQQNGLMNPDDDGMEMTVPLGRLRRVKSDNSDTDKADSLELKVVDETYSEDGSTTLPVESETHKNTISGIDCQGETHNYESSLREVDMVKSEIDLKGIHSAAQNSPTINSEILEKHLLLPSDEPENRDLEVDINAEPIPEDIIKMKSVCVASRLSLSRTEEEQVDEYHSVDKVPVCKAEFKTQSVDMMHESKVGFDPCSEKMNQHVENGAVVPQEEEEIIPVQEAMEQSLSEVVEDEPHVSRANMEFQGVSETSFGGGELMEICSTPTKQPESPNMRSNVQDVAALEPLDPRLVSREANCQHVESDLNPTRVSLERDEHQFEKRMGKRKSVECDQSDSFTKLPLAVRGEIEGNEAAQEESVGMEAEMDFTRALGKLKPQKKKNKMMDDVPPIINATTNARHGADKDSSIIDPKPNAIDLDVVPSVNSGFAPTCDNNQQPLKDPSHSPVNRIGVSSEEVPMECVSFSWRDSHVLGNDGVEPMDDKCVEDEEEPCGVKSNDEIKSIHSSEVDFEPREESSGCQVADQVSDMALSSTNQEEPCNSTYAPDVNALNPEKSPEAIGSIEDWLRNESSKESCDWAVYVLFENQFSFLVFHEAAVLIVNLVPLREGCDSKDKRNVESILLKSCLTDESHWCWKIVMEAMLKRFSPSFLLSKCSSTEQLPSLLEFLNSEFVALNLMRKQIHMLQRVCPVVKKCDGYSFRVPSMKLMLLFEVKINLLNWDRDGIKPKDVLVKNLIGKMGLTEIQSIVWSVKCDEHYLRNIYKDILNFVDTLEDVLE